MENSYLLDTNILIYYADGLLTNWQSADSVFEDSFLISIISKIEFLGWAGFRGNDNQYNAARDFISNAFVYYLYDDIAEETIVIRQKYKIKMPDAVIAATALINNLTLVTANSRDFESTGEKLLIPDMR
jgi:hypothetical protein